MKVGDVLLFAPGVPFARLDLSAVEETVSLFMARVEGFYLRPAEMLSDHPDNAFACGLLCCAAIDFLARYSRNDTDPEDRFVGWVCDHALGDAAESRRLARRLFVDFRHGLVHEGRVKNGGQFSFDGDELISLADDVATVNPALLAKAVRRGLAGHCERLRADRPAYGTFAAQLRREFRTEFRFSRR